MAEHLAEGLTFHDVNVGDIWISPARTITETDIVQFACLTGDFNPLHVDHEHCRQTPFQRPIAHGLLGLSYCAGLGSASPLMQTIAFLGIRQWRFLNPIFTGDTIHIRTEILEKIPGPRQRRGTVVWCRQVINQKGEICQEGHTETLVVGQPRATRDS